MSIPAYVIRQKRQAWPTAASSAIILNALRGGSEMAPKPTPATAAKRASERMLNTIVHMAQSRLSLTKSKVKERPMAMLMIRSAASVRRAKPVKT